MYNVECCLTQQNHYSTERAPFQGILSISTQSNKNIIMKISNMFRKVASIAFVGACSFSLCSCGGGGGGGGDAANPGSSSSSSEGTVLVPQSLIGYTLDVDSPRLDGDFYFTDGNVSWDYDYYPSATSTASTDFRSGGTYVLTRTSATTADIEISGSTPFGNNITTGKLVIHLNFTSQGVGNGSIDTYKSNGSHYENITIQKFELEHD